MSPDIATMSADEAVAEARRRDERRRQSLPLHEDATVLEERAARFSGADDRAEKDVQRDVWKAYRRSGCELYWMSQARKTRQTPGVPDLIVFRERQMWFHECKASGGVQSPAQKYFEEVCRLAGIVYVLGGVAAAEDHLIKIGAAYRDSSGSLEPLG